MKHRATGDASTTHLYTTHESNLRTGRLDSVDTRHHFEYGAPMDTGLNDIFGDTATAQPATADSYGIRPSAYRLPDATRIRSVTLQVSELARSRDFYENTLGFRPITVGLDRVSLGAHGNDDVLVELIENRAGKRRAAKGSLGLYHVAILLPTRADLGRFLRHLEEDGVRAGAGDHLVSEALYLQDPDNLGIEVYADRPREGWRRRNKQLVMATDPVDVQGLLAAAGSAPWSGIPDGTSIGHVHLHVGDIDLAGSFYSDGVGFDRVVWSYPGALFMSAGGYHHHLGTNVWAGAGAKPATPDDPQLLEWVLELPSEADVNAVSASLQRVGQTVTPSAEGTSITTRDPWGTALRVDVPRVGVALNL